LVAPQGALSSTEHHSIDLEQLILAIHTNQKTAVVNLLVLHTAAPTPTTNQNQADKQRVMKKVSSILVETTIDTTGSLIQEFKSYVINLTPRLIRFAR
jgi:hypothetical protein